MMGLLKIYFIYIFGSIISFIFSLRKGTLCTADYVDAIFLVAFIYFFMVNLSLYGLIKNEDKGTKMVKIMADQRADCLQENV